MKKKALRNCSVKTHQSSDDENSATSSDQESPNLSNSSDDFT